MLTNLTEVFIILIPTHSAWPASVKEIARATAYSERAVRTATNEMMIAGMLCRLPGRPAAYRVEPDQRSTILFHRGSSVHETSRSSDTDSHYWVYWFHLLGFLLAVVEWCGTPASAQVTAYVQSSQARDLYYVHEPAFLLNGIPVPRPEQYVGEEYLEGLSLTVTLVSDWLSAYR